MLRQLGYSNVRDYRGGLADWIEAGEPVESVAEAGSRPEPIAPPIGPPLTNESGTGPARVSLERRWNDALLELVDRLSTFQLFLLWLGLVSACGFAYWLGAFLGKPPLADTGSPIGADLRGLADAVYFSFVTATSVGFGDVLPVGLARVLAIVEAVAALLIFGAVIAKFVSHRQDELVREIYRVTFDERLDRVQSNLHVVISELLSINTLCETRAMPIPRIATQMDSAVLLFLAELRTTHDLLYQPRLAVQEGVLAAILADLASALEVLSELLTCLPHDFERSQPLQIALGAVSSLADDICGKCVPHAYTPRLVFWMDRVQNASRKIR